MPWKIDLSTTSTRAASEVSSEALLPKFSEKTMNKRLQNITEAVNSKPYTLKSIPSKQTYKSSPKL